MHRYKEFSPMDTILKARSFLHEHGILCHENWVDDIDGLYSLNLCIENTGFFVNGKGINRSFALASAYGELFERLQNLAFFRINTRIH